MRLLVWIILGMSIIGSRMSNASLPDPIELDSGPISGQKVRGTEVWNWLGIPYAAPPTGERRWREPQPVKRWKDVRICREFGAVCPQPAGKGLALVSGRQSEDCLTVNVWSGAQSDQERRAVMVWIHGGGNTIGSASQRFYNGSQFAAEGVVLVSIQYRLGIFGYLSHKELSAESEQGISGNYGLMDIIAALKWVKRNIAQFGGDPERVTIFGESAGAVNCGVLLVCPQAWGLFERVIMESGIPTGVKTTLAEAEDEGAMILKRLGAASIEQARQCSPRQLIEAVEAKVGILQKGHKYDPVIDGVYLRGEPMKLMRAGDFHRVPIIAGSNGDEATLFTRGLQIRRPGGYSMVMRAIFREDADDVLKVFGADYEGSPQESFERAVTVGAFTAPTRAWLRAASEYEPQVYLYHFTRVPSRGGRAARGATHGIEIPYVFNNQSLMIQSSADRELARQIQQYWIGFAEQGVPRGTNLAEWPEYEKIGDRHLEFGDSIQVGKGLYRRECDLFDRLNERRDKNRR